MTTVVIGTAGHIDHGKTTLLRALTGIDADRLPEEQRRGMTIDLGYAHLDLDDGRSIDFVDVPGHDGLVGNMLVGAGEIDAALLVVAADDGPRAQTLEHLELLDALAISEGLAVITKTDLVPPERTAEVRADVVDRLARTTLAGCEVVEFAATGSDVPSLRNAVVRLCDRVLPSLHAPDTGPRLPIDRVFAVRGRGGVVTGTLRGTIATGDAVRIEPGGRTARVREVQVHGRVVERSTGGRTALNLTGIDTAQLARGDVIVASAGSEIAATDRLFVAVRAPATWSAAERGWEPPRPGDRLRLHLGTSAVEARVARGGILADDAASPEAVRVLRLGSPIAVAWGDRFALRAPAPVGTVAAGRVLDVTPPRGPARRRASPERLAAVLAAVGPTARDRSLLDLHGYQAGTPPVLADDVTVSLVTAAVAAVRAHHDAEPDSAGITLSELRGAVAVAGQRLIAIDRPAAVAVAADVIAGLVTDGRLVRRGDRVDDAETVAAAPFALNAAMDRLEAALTVPAPPPLGAAARAAGCPPEGVAELARSGRIVRLEADLAWGASEFQRLAAVALSQARRKPLTPAAFRDASGTSRRYVLAILEDLDRRGILRRTPDGHVPGPRAPA